MNPYLPGARRPRRWWIAVAGGVAVVLVLAGIAVARAAARQSPAEAGASPHGKPPASASASPSRTRGTQVGQATPSFDGTTTNGRHVRVPGGRLTVLYFFAPGCASCGPHLRQLAGYERGAHGRDADVVAVNIDPPSEPVVAKFQRVYHATNVPTIKHADPALARSYHANYLGTTVVLDANGIVRWRGGAPAADRLQTIVARARQAG